MKIHINFLIFIFLIVITGKADAHYMWIETNPTGLPGEKHEVKIFYGEFSYNYREKINDGFKSANNFTVWLITPDQQKIKLETIPQDSFYSAEFIPVKEGTYKILLNNEDIEVADWREYDMGIVKQAFYAASIVNVGGISDYETFPPTADESNRLVITHYSSQPDKTNAPQKLKVFFNNKPLAQFELSVGITDGWIKKIYTDENGDAEFTAPWAGLYVFEAVFTEQITGNYKGKDYENIRSVATFSTLFSE